MFIITILPFTTDRPLQANLDTASQLLAYSRLLRKVVANDSFDFSVAQATAKWLAETLQASKSDFHHLRESVQNLTDAVSLTCGLGITEMWSTFMVEDSGAAASLDLQALEHASQNLGSAVDGLSLSLNIFPERN